MGLVANQGMVDDVGDNSQRQKMLQYRHKIKGFHLAFNVHEPVKKAVASTYKFRQDAKLSSDQVKLVVKNLGQKRELEKKQQKADELKKYQRDREQLRIMHEQMRKQK